MRQLLHFLLLLDLFGLEMLGGDAVGVLPLLRLLNLLPGRTFHLFHVPLLAQVELGELLLQPELLLYRFNVLCFHDWATGRHDLLLALLLLRFLLHLPLLDLLAELCV